MTLRSHKKRQITALMCNHQAKRFNTVSALRLICLLACSLALLLACPSPSSAQSYQNGLRAQETSGQSPNAHRSSANLQNDGWNLRYRKSSRSMPQPHHVPTPDVFAKDSTFDAVPRKSAAAVPNRLRDQRTANYYQDQRIQPRQISPQQVPPRQAPQQQVRPQQVPPRQVPPRRVLPTPVVRTEVANDPSRVIQAGWSDNGQHHTPNTSLNPAVTNPAVTPPATNSAGRVTANRATQPTRARQDFFSNPFGDPQANTPPPSSTPTHRVANQFDGLFEKGNSPDAPSGNPANSLRGSEPLTLPVPDDQLRAPRANLELPNPADASPSAEDNIFNDVLDPKEDNPSSPSDADDIRDMLRQGPEDKTKDDLQLPKPDDEADDGPSDRDDELDNPFERSRAERERDEEDLKKLRDRTAQGQEAGEGDGTDDLDKKITNEDDKPVGLTCEEFRQRIKRETIQTLSLDISPPFRPDVFTQEEYDELKGKFDAKQYLRPWRSIDGSVMANGRLVDLAYEKALVQTATGATQAIPINRLSEDDLAYISENWGLPKECRLEQVAMAPRQWVPSAVTWKAPNLCHKPLYFEDINLERYGHTTGPFLQPIVSSAHFFANIAVLPYKMGIHPPNECQYALGYYRPGDCAPWIIPPVPISLRGAVSQAAAATTGFLLIP